MTRQVAPVLQIADGPAVADVERACWQEFHRALHDRSHGWRTPTLATVDSQGHPQARTVVLRLTHPEARTLTVYSDSRAEKIKQLKAHPTLALVFWCARLGWQLRLQARATLITDGADHEQLRADLAASPAARDYLSPLAPGWPLSPQSPETAHPQSPMADRADPRSPTPATVASDLHLALIHMHVTQGDWLALSREGHRRVKFSPGQSALEVQA